MMLKHFLGSAVIVALLGFGGAGCSLFSNAKPAENTTPVEEASDDPGSFSSTSLGGGQGGAFGNGANSGATGFVDGAQGNIGGSSDGWVEADPSGNRLNMPIIYFAFDSDVLVPSEQANLNHIAEYLKKNPSLGLLIEGNCDQRGTEEYNRALGERRANAIRAYLAGRGIADSRMKTISYGKDRPAVEGTGEAVWSQNRRGVPVPMRMPRQ